MEFRVLGPVEVAVDGRPVAVGGPKPRTLLALLAVRAGRVVPAEQLIDAIWGEEPPESARAAVHTYVSTLRRALVEDVVVRGSGGYRLDVEQERVDLHVFSREAAAGRRALAAGRPEQAAAHFQAALEQWRGAALGGAQGEWADTERTRLDELRLAALEDRVDA